MTPDPAPHAPRTLQVLSALFILSFFLFFSYHGLFSSFTFDDGTTIFACLKPFETPLWRDLLHIVTVFTSAFRPLTTMFWRPLYAAFGFNPLPYRVVVHLLLIANIGVGFALARRLEATREAAALTALIFCYNASTIDLYYNTCLVADIMCFLLYGLAIYVYAGGRRNGNPLDWRHIAAFGALYLLALDSKELAVTLPGTLIIYELLYRYQDFRDRRKALQIGGLLAATFVAGAIYLKVKVADLQGNAAYTPHVTAGFILDNIAHYVQRLLYLPEDSVRPATAFLLLGAMILTGLLLRTRQAIFGVLYFVVTLIPVAVIAARSGYAAYLAYFGLAFAIAAILVAARRRLMALASRRDMETATAVLLFCSVAVLLAWGHIFMLPKVTAYFEWARPPVDAFLEDFRQTIPEFPPNARVLITDDPWEPDWGQMFLVRLMYHDNTVWVDRVKNLSRPPDLSSYDLVVSYQPPDVEVVHPRMFRHPVKWQLRGKVKSVESFTVSSPNAHGAASHVEFAPRAARSRQTVKITVPGLSKVDVSVLYRIVSRNKSTPYLVENWCTLDASGSCSVVVPSAGGAGLLVIDWIQPLDQRWIFTSGTLRILE